MGGRYFRCGICGQLKPEEELAALAIVKPEKEAALRACPECAKEVYDHVKEMGGSWMTCKRQ